MVGLRREGDVPGNQGDFHFLSGQEGRGQVCAGQVKLDSLAAEVLRQGQSQLLVQIAKVEEVELAGGGVADAQGVAVQIPAHGIFLRQGAVGGFRQEDGVLRMIGDFYAAGNPDQVEIAHRFRDGRVPGRVFVRIVVDQGGAAAAGEHEAEGDQQKTGEAKLFHEKKSFLCGMTRWIMDVI